MPTITQILEKVIPKLQTIEEDPEVTILRVSALTASNPFSGSNNEVFDTKITIPCVYSEQPEIVTSNSNITTQQQLYFYIQQKVVAAKGGVWGDGKLTMHDSFVFNESRYRPVEVQLLFGLWKIKVNKE